MRRRWVWGAYALSVAWVGLVFAHVHRYLTDSRAEVFRQEGRRLAAVWADRVAGATDASSQEKLIRRFSGDFDSRSVSLFNDQGQTIQNVGGPPPSLPRIPFSEPKDRRVDSDAWAFWAPLWVDGRRAGYLAWVRNSSVLYEDGVRFQRGLLAAWAWWAAAGALGFAFASKPS